MSYIDSDCYEPALSPPQPPPAKTTKAPKSSLSKRKSTPFVFEADKNEGSVSAPKIRKPSKPKIAPVSNAAALAKRPRALITPPDSEEFPWTERKKDIFSLIKAEDEASSAKKNKTSGRVDVDVSSFCMRVSGGQTRRTATITEGDYYLELKLYNTLDYQNSPPDQRYKKAISSVKLRTDENTREWWILQELLTTTYKLFENSTPTKFDNK